MQGVPETFAYTTDRAVFRRPVDRPGLELYRAHIRHHAFEPHLHDGYGLGMIEAGAQRFRYLGREHEAAAGALVLMQPGELHTGGAVTPEGWTYRMLYLDEALLREHLGGAPAWHFSAAVQPDAPRALRFGQLLGQLWDTADALTLDSLLAEALALLQPLVDGPRQALPASAQRHDFKAVQQALMADLARPWRLAELAALAGMSACHFQRAFKAAHRVSPHQWAMAQRLAQAKRLLAAGRVPAEVAVSVGLADQAHLTRKFAAMYGVTPGRYQRDVGVR